MANKITDIKLPTIKIGKPSIGKPTFRIELVPETAKLIDSSMKILSGAIVLHAIAQIIKK